MTPATTPAAPPMQTPSTPFGIPAASHAYLERAASSLREAITTTEIPLRYAQAHVAALRATAALLAARATPTLGQPRRGRSVQKNAAHSASSGATSASSTQAFFCTDRPRRGWPSVGVARAASRAAVARSAATWACA